MFLDSFQAVFRTAWIKPAIWAQQRTYEIFVRLKQSYQQDTHRSTNLSQCFSNDFLKTNKGAFAASPRANTTISMLTICCLCNLKLSLAVLLTRFLATAVFIVFFAIASPSRGYDRLLGVANTVKYLSVDFTGLVNTFLKSAGVPSRN